MIFKRTGGKTYASRHASQTADHKRLPTGAPFTAAGKALAQRIAAMSESVAVEHRAWDLLEKVLTASHGEQAARLGRLYDLWVSTRYDVGEMRRLLSDVNLEPLRRALARLPLHGVSTGYTEHIIVHVRSLLPEAEPCPLSRVTTAWLTERLASYPGKRNTLRQVHSAWSLLFEHVTRVHGLFPRIRWTQVDAARRGRAAGESSTSSPRCNASSAAQPTAKRRTCVVRRPVWDRRRKHCPPAHPGRCLRISRGRSRPAGTKTRPRDQVAVVADWASGPSWGPMRGGCCPPSGCSRRSGSPTR